MKVGRIHCIDYKIWHSNIGPGIDFIDNNRVMFGYPYEIDVPYPPPRVYDEEEDIEWDEWMNEQMDRLETDIQEERTRDPEEGYPRDEPVLHINRIPTSVSGTANVPSMPSIVRPTQAVGTHVWVRNDDDS
jgi:hypothetical protein